MNAPPQDPVRLDRARLREEAIDWLLRVSTPEADAEDRAACARWRAEDARHEEAFGLAERTWERLPETDAAQASRATPDASNPGPNRPAVRRGLHRFKPSLAILAPIGLAAALATIFLMFDRPSGDHLISTPVGEIRQFALEDGSVIDLGAASRIRVAMTDRERRVALEDGQAFFDVAHDAGRPFVVEAGNAEIRVTGTKFDVWALGDHVQVSVAEGSVVVRRRAGGQVRAADEVRTLHAGDRAAVEDNRLVETAPVAGLADPGEWRTGRLFYANTPLGVVVADANRYASEPIVVTDDGLKSTKVTVSFRTGEIDQLIGALEGSLPIRIERQQGQVMIEPR